MNGLTLPRTHNRQQPDVDFVLRVLVSYSDDHIDESIRIRLEPLIGLWPDAVAARMKLIIQDCENTSLASSDAPAAMHEIYHTSASRGLLSINI